MWEVEFTDEFEAWWDTLTPDEQVAIDERIALLQQRGPALRRPVVGEITGSAFDPQMKELIASVGTAEIRILFMFDPRRTAILLTGGDKAQAGFNDWYPKAIAEADRLYEEHLATLKKEGEI